MRKLIVLILAIFSLTYGEKKFNLTKARFLGDMTVNDSLIITDAPGGADTLLVWDDGSTTIFKTDNTFVFTTTSNSSSAFIFEQSDGTDVLIVDTSAPQVIIAADATVYPASSGSAVLLVRGASASAASIQIDAGNASSAAMYFGDTDANAQGTIIYANSDNSMRFGTNATERWRITSAGVLQSNGPQSITTGGNNLLTLDGGTAGVRLDDIIGIGVNPNVANMMTVSGTPSGTGSHRGFNVYPALTPGVNGDANGIQINPSITEASSGTHPTLAGLFINAFTVTDGGGTEAVTNLAGIYVMGAPNPGTTPTNGPYSIFVDSGISRFDGDGSYVFELPADATDPTGGGGAATGRIPVKIGGVTRYIAYY